MTRFVGSPAVVEGPPVGPDPPEGLDVTVDSVDTLITGVIDGEDWHGRPIWIKREDGILVLIMRSGSAHAVNDGALHIYFYDPVEQEWSDRDKTLAGASVSGFPMNPSTLSPGEDAGEPWHLKMPSGKHRLFMWRADYFVTKGGTWTSLSDDDSCESWAASEGPIQWDWFDATVDTHNRTYCTDDGYVDPITGTSWISGRIYTSVNQRAANFCLFKSEDPDGAVDSWERVSYIAHSSEAGGRGVIESSLSRVGDKFVAMCRDGYSTHSYQRETTDLTLTGANWGTLVDVTSAVGIACRQRTYSVAELKGEANPHLDTRWIMTGFNLQVSGQSIHRRNCIWISLDSMATWSLPFYIDVTFDDGGYGDITWIEADKYAVASYTGTLNVADTKIYWLTITGL